MQESVSREVTIAAQAIPWSMECKSYTLPEGMNVAEMLERLISPVPLDVITAHVYAGPLYIERDEWEDYVPSADLVLTIKILPMGGGGKKNPLAIVLSIAVIAAAAWASPLIVGAGVNAGLFTAGSIGAKIAGALASGIITAVGNMLIAAIAPPPKQRLSGGSKADSPTLFIEGARNDIRLNGVVPIILGYHRHVPPLAAGTYTETVGDKQFVRQLFCLGLGKYEIEQEKIGETLLSSFEEIETQHVLDASGKNTPSTLYPNSVIQEGLQVQLKNPDDTSTTDDDTSPGAWVLRTTQPDADEFSVDLSLPKGLGKYDSSGNLKSATVKVDIRYSLKDMNDWSSIVTVEITSQHTNAIVHPERFKPAVAGQYDVQMRRVTKDAKDDKTFDETWWTALRTVVYENPIGITGISFVGLRARATDQLNGAIDQYNLIQKSIVPDWDTDTQTWIERKSQNPASLFRFVAQNAEWFDDPVNAPNVRPLSDERVDIAKLQEFHEYCVEQGFTCNIIIDYETNVWDVLGEIAACGRATVAMIDSKWTVIIDQEQEVISQHFTAANSWGFKGSIDFPEVPHALRVEFINEDIGYVKDERLVFDDGYSEFGEVAGTSPAVIYQGLQLPGTTDPDVIWKLGREYLAVMRLRPREIAFMADAEHLAASKGKRIKFAHPTALIGTAQGYIKEVSYNGDDEIYAIRLDRQVQMSANRQYRVRIRNANTNASAIMNVNSVSGDTDTLVFDEPFLFSDTNVHVDDLFLFGERNYEDVDLIVRDVISSDDLTAKLVCLDAAPGIFQAATGPIPPFVSGITIPLSLLRPIAPIIRSIQTGIEAQVRNIDGSISSRVVISLTNNNPFDCMPVVKVKPSEGTQFEYARVIFANATTAIVEGLQARTRYDFQIYYRKVLNSDLNGLGGNVFSPITTANRILFQGEEDLPPNITNLLMQVFGATSLLYWDAVTVLDFSHYEVRYQPNLVGFLWENAAVVKTGFKANEAVVPTATGVYLVKAFDRGGRGSAVATYYSQSIIMEGNNVVETRDEDTAGFIGTHSNTKVEHGKLKLANISVPLGYYYFVDGVDLGEVFTNRVIPHLVAAGENIANTMDRWTSLAALASLAGSYPSEWAVTIEEQHTNDDPSFGSQLLDDAGQLLLDDTGASILADDAASAINWSAWAPVTLGFYIFRGMRFRIKLQGNGTNVTPAIEELRVVIDMPDRVESDTNIAIPDTGYALAYAPAFHVKPHLVVTLTDMQAGDVLTITGESATGATIVVTNASVGVARHMNYVARGYGRVVT